MFSKFFIERPRFAMVISIVLTLAGAIAVFSLPISLYPEITPPEVTVRRTIPVPAQKCWQIPSVFRWRKKSTAWKTCCI